MGPEEKVWKFASSVSAFAGTVSSTLLDIQQIAVK